MNCIYFVQIILFRFITLELSVKFSSQICHEDISTSLDGAYIVGFGIGRHYSGPHDAMQVFFSWGASMNSRGWTHYHLYSSVPNSSACTFINFEGKIHYALSYFGSTFIYFEKTFHPVHLFHPPRLLNFTIFHCLQHFCRQNRATNSGDLSQSKKLCKNSPGNKWLLIDFYIS